MCSVVRFYPEVASALAEAKQVLVSRNRTHSAAGKRKQEYKKRTILYSGFLLPTSDCLSFVLTRTCLASTKIAIFAVRRFHHAVKTD